MEKIGHKEKDEGGGKAAAQGETRTNPKKDAFSRSCVVKKQLNRLKKLKVAKRTDFQRKGEAGDRLNQTPTLKEKFSRDLACVSDSGRR